MYAHEYSIDYQTCIIDVGFRNKTVLINLACLSESFKHILTMTVFVRNPSTVDGTINFYMGHGPA